MHHLWAQVHGDRAGYRASEKDQRDRRHACHLGPLPGRIRVLAIIDYCLWLASVKSNWSRSIRGAGAALSTARTISGWPCRVFGFPGHQQGTQRAMSNKHARASRLPTPAREQRPERSGSCFSMRFKKWA